MWPSSLICTTEYRLGPTSGWRCRTHNFRCILETWRIHLTLPLLMNFTPLFFLACITRLQFAPLPSARLPWTKRLYLSHSLPHHLRVITCVPIPLAPVPVSLDPLPPHILHRSYDHQLLHLHLLLLFLTEYLLLLLMIHWLGFSIHSLVRRGVQGVQVAAEEAWGPMSDLRLIIVARGGDTLMMLMGAWRN